MQRAARRGWGLVATLALAGYGSDAIAQAALVLAGARAVSGNRTVGGRVVPDPMEVSVVSGGAVDARLLGLGPGCFGFVTAVPTVIVRVTAPVRNLRFFVTAPSDTTLLVHSAGRWVCSDDSWGGTNPTVDLPLAVPGSYDVWVGSFRAGDQLRSTLHLTQNSVLHP